MHDMFVADDDPIVRVTLAEALRDEGFDVLEASTGAEAVSLLAEAGGARVLVTDVFLGSGPDGITLAAEALRRWPEILVIYMTARPRLLAGLKLDRRQRVLIKPFMPSYLVEVARDMMVSLTAC